jgi:regulator of sigma E protease
MIEPFRTLITVVLFIVVLGSLVLIHEIGHFVMARLARIRVLEFGIGFPPRARILGEGRASAEDVALAASRRDRALAEARLAGDRDLVEAILDEEPERARGTLYTLNWLPIGGFVKLEGEDGDDAGDPRSFASARLPTKVVILLAGVMMNLLLSLAIFTLIAWLASPVVGRTIPKVEPGSPADRAHLVAGDSIVSVNGMRHDLFTLGTSDVIDDLRQNLGQTVTLQIAHADGTRADVPVTLRTAEETKDPDGDGPLLGKGALGITVTDQKVGFPAFFSGDYVQRDLPTAVGIGANETVRWFGVIIDGLASLGHQVVTDPTAAPPVSGPIGIATQIGDIFFGAGIVMTIYVMGILSANLALVNILPFPPLDGGRILMLVLKRVLGARLSLRAEQMTYVVGFAFLFAFLIWVSGFDIVRILSGGGS